MKFGNLKIGDFFTIERGGLVYQKMGDRLYTPMFMLDGTVLLTSKSKNLESMETHVPVHKVSIEIKVTEEFKLFKDLLKGQRFRYPGYSDIYTKIMSNDTNAVFALDKNSWFREIQPTTIVEEVE